MKRTILYNTHKELGAQMVPFAGYEMPIKYTSVKEEHLCVRNKVGIFDVSHMGEIIVKGEDAKKFLQKISSNNIEMLSIGQAQYGYIPNLNCGIIDDFVTYCLSNNEYLLVVNASNVKKVMDWLYKYRPSGVKVSDISERVSLLAVQGPRSIDVIQGLTDKNLNDIAFYHFDKGAVEGVEDIIISHTGYTGELGFELYVPNIVVSVVWDAIMKAGEKYGLQPIGLGARDTLRMEMGYRLYGNDISEDTNPIDAGLVWATDFSTDFIGKNQIEKSRKSTERKRFRGLVVKERGIPRAGYKLYQKGVQIGEVTSGTMSPSMNCGIGLASIDKDYAKIGSIVEINIRGKGVKAELVSLPIYKKNDKKS